MFLHLGGISASLNSLNLVIPLIVLVSRYRRSCDDRKHFPLSFYSSVGIGAKFADGPVAPFFCMAVSSIVPVRRTAINVTGALFLARCVLLLHDGRTFTAGGLAITRIVADSFASETVTSCIVFVWNVSHASIVQLLLLSMQSPERYFPHRKYCTTAGVVLL